MVIFWPDSEFSDPAGMFRKIIFITLFLVLTATVIAAGALAYGYHYVTRDLPRMDSIADFRPPAVSRVYAADGSLLAEFYKERRYPVKIAEIPDHLRKAFLAAEDASFYQHQGIDYFSILRAIKKNLESGSMKQGGSTITQQVVKNLLLTSERSLLRKVKEAILSFQLEHRFSKDEILEIYLNQIFFGNNAYGIRAAAKAYFHKELSEVTLAEAAILAGLPKAPSKFSPLVNFRASQRRQAYVLEQMVKAGFATQEAVTKALAEKVQVYPARADNFYHAPFYVAEVRKILQESPRWRSLDIDADGLEITTALDPVADRMGQVALRKGLREVDKRRGWRGPIATFPDTTAKRFLAAYESAIPTDLEYDTVYPALVTEVSRTRGISVDLGHFTAQIDVREVQWAKKRLDREDRVTWIKPEEVLRAGDVIEVSIQKRDPGNADTLVSGEPVDLAHSKLILDQTPDIEGCLVLLDPHSGRVMTTIGGYSYQRSQFNRVTQSLRQPGSAFKPILYLAAVDSFGYTPATIVYDQPRTFRVGDELWTPGNFDQSFLGPITLRTALERSRNLVSADIVSRIGVDAVISYARKLGVTSKLGRNPSISLGSSEVTMLELARAYGVFAAKGVLFDSSFITKIVDRTGKEIYDGEAERLASAHQVVNENSAFVMANLMKGVVEHGTGYVVKAIGRPVAGKTGTSNDQMDTWFIGYTPSLVAGVWVGFDLKKKIGEKETGGKVAAPIWLYFMRDYLTQLDEREYRKTVEETRAEAQRLGVEYVAPERLAPLDFTVPPGVEPFWVDKNSGVAVEPNAAGGIYEYFVRGTEPNKSGPESAPASELLDSPEL